METAPTLICIPDISGFTSFMSEVDFELGAKVIPSLMNNIIYSNEIGLKVSEIEGDAVLFYRQGELPPILTLISQCKIFYSEFYKNLFQLRKNLNKYPKAELIPKILGLKIILHFAKEIAPVPIGKHIKLMGEDVIIAHRLLKNDVPSEEYILMSEELLNQYSTKDKNNDIFSELNHGKIKIEHLGVIKFSYINLIPPN